VRELEEDPYRDIGIAYTSWENVSPIGRAFVEAAKQFFQAENRAE
jgi:hypothetical protein